MMLGFLGQPSDFDVFRYQLCDLLHKTPDEIDGIPYPEFIALASYFKAKNAKASERSV
jgi:hypothetical protein